MQKDSKWVQTVTNNYQNGAKRVFETNNMEPKGYQSEPRDLPKHPLRIRSEKVRKKWGAHIYLSIRIKIDKNTIRKISKSDCE